MTRRTPLVRLSLLSLATLQLLITGAAAWADARLDAAGPKGPIHVESHATQACAPIHPADCILHRFLSTPGRVVRPVAIALGLPVGQSPSPAAIGIVRSTLKQRHPAIRGPPLS